MKEYIHYGATEFKPELFMPIRNEIRFTKPSGGFWASPIDADRGWRQWCIDEDFRECNEHNSFKFTLSESANVLLITDREQLLTLPHIGDVNNMPYSTHFLDFEMLVLLGVDAVEITISGLYMALYGWDVDSILIMNPNIVVPIMEDR